MEYRGTKQELIYIIEQYFKGNLIKKSSKQTKYAQVDVVTLDTPLLECGFSFNAKFREYFSTLTGITPFKFTANMAAAWRKVKREKNIAFTIQEYAENLLWAELTIPNMNNTVCQWNQFLRFCAEKQCKLF